MPRSTRTIFLSGLASLSLVVALAAPPTQAQQPGKKTGSGSGNALRVVAPAPPPGLLLFQKAIAATDAKKYSEAERLYRKLLKDQPDIAAAWANLGLLLGLPERHDYAGAIRCLEKATKIEPQTGPYWAQLSAMQLRAGKWQAAETSAKTALKYDAKSGLALANMADAQMQQRHFSEAVVSLRKLRELEGGSGDPHTELSLIMALTAAGKKEDALTLARKRAERTPKDVNAQLVLGDVARMNGQMAEAKRAYEAAQKLDLKNQGAASGLAISAAVGGDRESAMRLLDERLDKNPDDASLQFQRGFLVYSDTRFRDAERCKQAEAYFRRASLLSPKNPGYITYYALSLVFQGSDRYAEASKLLVAALSLDPKFTFARLAAANLAERQNRPEDAGAQYRAILDYAPNDKESHRGMAGIFYTLGKKAEAYQEMEKTAALDPKDTRVLAELGSWQMADGALPAAQRTYQNLLTRDAKDADAHLALGQIYERTEKLDAAQKEYEAALDADPKNTAAALLVGSLLTTRKQPEAAATVYRQLLTANPQDNQIRWQLAHTLQDMKRYDDALAEMRRITLRKDDPNRMEYVLGAPRLLMAQKRAAEAIPLLLQVIQETPQDEEARYTLADAYEQANRFDDAERLLLELRNHPTTADPKKASPPGSPTPQQAPAESARPYVALAGLYERAARPEDAARNYEEALRIDPRQRPALVGLSSVREKQGKPEAAREYLEKLITTDAEEPNLPVIGALREYHVLHQTLAQYVTFTQNLLKKYPENRVAQYVRARAVTDGKPEETARKEAIGLYERILEKRPNDTESRLQLGLQYEAVGRKQDAITAFRTVLRLNSQNAEAASGLKRLGATMTATETPGGGSRAASAQK